jgi:hypothetical protein
MLWVNGDRVVALRWINGGFAVRIGATGNQRAKMAARPQQDALATAGERRLAA